MPFHWASDMNPSFALARKLVARGHAVHYLGIADIEERVVAEGFDFTPVFDAAFPRGSLAAQAARAAAGRPDGADAFRARVRATCDALRGGELIRKTRTARADCLVVSSGTPWVGIAAPATDLPVLNFASTLISMEDPLVPPFKHFLVPDGSLRFRIRTKLAWKRLFLAQRLFGRAWDVSNELRSLARSLRFPLERIDFRVQTWPRLLLPELVFCPREFDFPRERPPVGAAFVEPSIDLRRHGTAFPWHEIAEEKPLVYCSLGTIAVSWPERVRPFLQTFLDALSLDPSHQGVVAIGSALQKEDLRCPPNAVVVSEAPQIDVLRRAALFVTHGGFNSVKEAIHFGVPMLVAPLFYDQPGNAARVVHHGLGARANFRRITAPELRALIDRTLSDGRCRACVERMSATFVEAEKRAPSIEVIEEVMAGRRATPLPC